jgi:hypothetical protein
VLLGEVGTAVVLRWGALEQDDFPCTGSHGSGPAISLPSNPIAVLRSANSAAWSSALRSFHASGGRR